MSHTSKGEAGLEVNAQVRVNRSRLHVRSAGCPMMSCSERTHERSCHREASRSARDSHGRAEAASSGTSEASRNVATVALPPARREAAFRAMETETLRGLVAQCPARVVIATGAGAVLTRANCELRLRDMVLAATARPTPATVC